MIYTLFALGFVLLIKGADFLVDGSASIAKRFNISNLVVRHVLDQTWNQIRPSPGHDCQQALCSDSAAAQSAAANQSTLRCTASRTEVFAVAAAPSAAWKSCSIEAASPPRGGICNAVPQRGLTAMQRNPSDATRRCQYSPPQNRGAHRAPMLWRPSGSINI